MLLYLQPNRGYKANLISTIVDSTSSIKDIRSRTIFSTSSISEIENTLMTRSAIAGITRYAE